MKSAKTAKLGERTISQMVHDFVRGATIRDSSGRVEEFGRFIAVCDERASDGLPRNQYGMLSNLIDGWERVPKYCLTAREQSRARNADGKLESITKDFSLAGRSCRMLMHPARIYDEKSKSTTEYFPTPHDQAVEHILIRMFATRDKAEFFGWGDQKKAMLRFRLRDIWRVLKEHRMQRNITQIKHSINVLAGTQIKLSMNSGYSYSSTIIGSVSNRVGSDYTIVSLPDIVCCAIWSAKYTQFSFSSYMRLKSPLSRWLLISMSMQKNLSPDRPFRLSLQDVKMSGLVTATRLYDQARTCESAIEELRKMGLIVASDGDCAYIKDVIREMGRMCDANYTLIPSRHLVKHIKASNHREKSKPRSFSALPNEVIAKLTG